MPYACTQQFSLHPYEYEVPVLLALRRVLVLYGPTGTYRYILTTEYVLLVGYKYLPVPVHPSLYSPLMYILVQMYSTFSVYGTSKCDDEARMSQTIITRREQHTYLSTPYQYTPVYCYTLYNCTVLVPYMHEMHAYRSVQVFETVLVLLTYSYQYIVRYLYHTCTVESRHAMATGSVFVGTAYVPVRTGTVRVPYLISSCSLPIPTQYRYQYSLYEDAPVLLMLLAAVNGIIQEQELPSHVAHIYYYRCAYSILSQTQSSTVRVIVIHGCGDRECLTLYDITVDYGDFQRLTD